MIDCPSHEQLLGLLNDNQIQSEDDTLVDHVGECEHCQKRLEDLSVGAEPWHTWQEKLQDHKLCWPDTTINGIGRAEPGTWPTLAGYEILSMLGSGGMGVVYKARHVTLNRLVALKMLRADFKHNPDLRRRFYQEAETVAHLRHPNLVQIYDIIEHQNNVFLALEYVEGKSLADWLHERPLSPHEAAELVETLARTMQSAHDAGIVHRDLKPANILLEMEKRAKAGNDTLTGNSLNASSAFVLQLSSIRPKITDFGLARKWESPAETKPGELMGTPSYMAPEQAGAEPDWSRPAVDIYALGTCLYEALTGRPPFRAESPYATLLLIKNEEPVPPSQIQPTVPRDLETICMKCLEKNPANRYHSCEDLAEDLRRFQADEPIRARRSSRFIRGWKWIKRHPLVSSLILAVFGCVIALIATLIIVTALLVERIQFTNKIREVNAELAKSNQNLAKESELAKQKQREAEKAKQELAKESELAKQKQREAEKAKQEAERERSKAKEDLLKMGKILQDYVGVIHKNKDLKRIPSLHAQLIQLSFDSYAAILELYGKDRDLELESAAGYFWLGTLSMEMGDGKRAHDFFDRAVKIHENIDPKRFENIAEWTRGAVYLSFKGEALAAQKKMDQAKAAYLDAVKYLERVQAKYGPADEILLVLLAKTHDKLGALLSSASGEEESAQSHLLTARKNIQLALNKDRDGSIHSIAGKIERNLGVLYERGKEHGKAESAYAAAVENCEKAAKLNRNNPDHAQSLATNYCYLAAFFSRRLEPEKALERYSQAAYLREKLAKRFPSFSAHVNELSLIYSEMGKLNQSQMRLPQASIYYRKSLTLLGTLIRHAPNNWELESRYAKTAIQLVQVTDPAKSDESAPYLKQADSYLQHWASNPIKGTQALELLSKLKTPKK